MLAQLANSHTSTVYFVQHTARLQGIQRGLQGGQTAIGGGVHLVVGAGQPAKIEQHAIRRAGGDQFGQTCMVVHQCLPDGPQPGGAQPCVGVFHGGRLNIQRQHPARGSCQAAQKLGVVAVAAGGVHIQSARLEVGCQKFMAKLHRRKIRHPAADHLAALGQKAELFQ